MLAQEIIRSKRDGSALSGEQIREFVKGLTGNGFSDAQVSALAMAILLNGMDRDETAALTLAMRDSGQVLDWSHLSGPVVDKHSTGGVGDNVSLMLAPIVAACGAYVPMISGRGLGHTGGTLDKMDSIPGYVSYPDTDLFTKTVQEVGFAIIGSTASLAPADKRLYAIRDVTATVDSPSLITASILSKKLAAGVGGLVLDVKCGNGAFMDDMKQANELALCLFGSAEQARLRTFVRITDMNQPLANAAGNAVEMKVALDFLTGRKRHGRLLEIISALAADMLVLAGLAETFEQGKSDADRVLENGAAAEQFGRMVAALGGPSDFVDRYEQHLPKAKLVVPVEAERNGFVAQIATRDVGVAVIDLGGGRRNSDDRIDLSVGFSQLAAIGQEVRAGEPIGFVHAANEADAQKGAEALAKAYRIEEERCDAAPVLLKRIG